MEAVIARQIASSRVLSSLVRPISNWFMNASGYQKLGLKFDDVLIEETPEVQEALRRLTPQEVYDRHYRHKVAIQNSLMHSILPQDQWTTKATDAQYLTPTLNEVLAEKAERQAFATPQRSMF